MRFLATNKWQIESIDSQVADYKRQIEAILGHDENYGDAVQPKEEIKPPTMTQIFTVLRGGIK